MPVTVEKSRDFDKRFIPQYKYWCEYQRVNTPEKKNGVGCDPIQDVKVIEKQTNIFFSIRCSVTPYNKVSFANIS